VGMAAAITDAQLSNAKLLAWSRNTLRIKHPNVVTSNYTHQVEYLFGSFKLA
jgi:hypothetical protein